MTQTTPQRLSMGKNYTLMVQSISGPKTFNKANYPGVPFYCYRITFADKSGKTYQGEYVAANMPTQDKFKTGEEAEFHVCFIGPMADEICPGHEEVSPADKPGTWTSTTQTTTTPVYGASGQTYTFAMGYAKDIYCAMIKEGFIGEKGPGGDAPDSPESIARLVGMAKQINEGLIEMQQEQNNRSK